MRLKSSGAAAVVSLVYIAQANAFAQSTRTEEIEQQKAAKAASVATETQDADGNGLSTVGGFIGGTSGLKLTWGGFRPGAGLTPGVAWVMPVGAGGRWMMKSAWSSRNFKLLESTFDLPRFAGERLQTAAFVRWEDAPGLSFFGVGSDSLDSHEIDYGLRSTNVGANGRFRIAGPFSGGAALEYLHIDLSPDTTFLVPSSAASWIHASTFLAFDTRVAPGYTDRGTLCQVAFHSYSDRHGLSNFTRTEVDLRHFVPVLNDNWIIALQGRADLTSAPDDQVIPFFMLPYVGGGDTLRGYRQYRFTDRDTLLLRAELRWTPASVVDMAAFVDTGTAAPSVRALDLNDLKRGWGLGARIHGDTFTALRLEIARGSEGWRYHVAHTASF